MKIIQVNCWLGRLNGPLARFIRSEAPDILCLQEGLMPLDEDLPAFRDQYHFLKELQQAGDLRYLSFSPSWGYIVSGAVINVGNAILSKYPLLNERQAHINNSYYVAKHVGDYRANTRTIQSAKIKLNEQTLTVANHQAFLSGETAKGDEESREKMSLAARFLSELSHPLIFCGDLNVNPDTATIAALNDLQLRNLTAEFGLRSTLSEARRAPDSDRRAVACDYIFISKDIEIRDFSVADKLVSDHKALILEFEI